MDHYFTVFLCSLEWKETDRIFQFIDWLIGNLPLREELHLIARRREDSIKQEPTVSGDFFKLRHLLRELPLASLSLSNRKWVSGATELFVAFENVNYTFVYLEAEPQKIEVPNGLKVFSFSVRRDLWVKCEESGLSVKLLENVETLFGAINCIYGYADAPLPLITGGLCQINKTEMSRNVRIVDFDYTHYIERVYRYNYLSTGLLSCVANPDELREFKAHVQYKDLHDLSGQIAGAAIYLRDISPTTVQELSRLLGPVLPATV